MDVNRRFHEVGTLSGINKMVDSYKRMALIIGILSFIGLIVNIVFMSVTASRAQGKVYVAQDYRLVKVKDKQFMVKSHVALFLTKFFALDPNNLKSSPAEALNLIGNDGKRLLNTYKEGQWFNRIVMDNLNINVDIESIEVDMSEYPYAVAFESNMVIQRDSRVQKRYLNGHCRVSETSNSEENPFGMMIQDFVITKNSDYEEKK